MTKAEPYEELGVGVWPARDLSYDAHLQDIIHPLKCNATLQQVLLMELQKATVALQCTNHDANALEVVTCRIAAIFRSLAHQDHRKCKA